MRIAITAVLAAMLLAECSANTFVVNNQAASASDKNPGTDALPPAAFDGKYQLITSKLMGKVALADMFMEHPDGKGLNITSDFYGKPIDPKKVLPGPFQGIKKGDNTFKVWPQRRKP